MLSMRVRARTCLANGINRVVRGLKSRLCCLNSTSELNNTVYYQPISRSVRPLAVIAIAVIN